LLVIQACAGAGQVRVKEGREIEMAATSFRFEPSLVEVERTGHLVIRVHNEAAVEHNLTVKDPQGRVIAASDLPPGETVAVEVDLDKVGTYPFYCDKPLHATLGMTGEIVVTAEQK